jgi:hypothetical protein
MLGELENQFPSPAQRSVNAVQKKQSPFNREHFQAPACVGGFQMSGPAPGSCGRRYHPPGVDALARNVAGEDADDYHP